MGRRHVLLFLMSSLLVLANGLNDCLPSREAYTNLGLGPAEDVPVNFTIGVGADICPMTTMTCCPLSVEESMEAATARTLDSFAPEYRDYLDLSDVVFFDHYGYVSDIAIQAIQRYFELSVPAKTSSEVRSALDQVIQLLKDIHNSNGGRRFNARFRDLFSITYLERMKGIYDLGPNVTTYSSSFTRCAEQIIETEVVTDAVREASEMIRIHFRSLFQFREVLFSMHYMLTRLEAIYPLAGCGRSYAELFYCQICSPETSAVRPCRNLCKNIVAGCTITLNDAGEAISQALQSACELNTLTTSEIWNLHTSIQVINEELYAIFDTSTEYLLRLAANVSSCNEAPNITMNPSPTEYPDRTTHGREHFLSYVPTSLTDFLYQTFVTNFTSMYVRFENVTERALESECGDFPEDDDSIDFECWQGDRSAGNDVDFLGYNLNTVLLNNPDLDLPQSDEMLIDIFVSSVGWVGTNASTARSFVNNNNPADVDIQNCAVLVSQVPPTFPPVIPTTRSMIDAIPPPTIPTNNGTNNTTDGISPTPDGGSATRLTAGLLLIPLLLMALAL